MCYLIRVVLLVIYLFQNACLTLFFLFLFIASDMKFASEYEGNTVTGLVGSSVNFTWSFSGDVRLVDWGLSLAGANLFQNGKRLVSLTKVAAVPLSVPAAYAGRVSGRRSGNASSGLAIFTLANITKNDERFYGCRLNPTAPDGSTLFDTVYLFVEGNCMLVKRLFAT